MVDQMETHYSSDGFVLPKSSDEAKRQMELEKMEADAEADFARMINPPKDADCERPAPTSSPPRLRALPAPRLHTRTDVTAVCNSTRRTGSGASGRAARDGSFPKLT